MATALLTIDVQRALVDGLEPDRRNEFLTVLASLLERARSTGIPVIYVRHRSDELVPQTDGWQIASEVAPRASETIVEKTHCDSFRNTNLADVLERHAIDDVAICGMQTEFCVDATLREAERRGYSVTLVADAHATYDGGGLTERQIRDHVNRVAMDFATSILPANEVFAKRGA